MDARYLMHHVRPLLFVLIPLLAVVFAGCLGGSDDVAPPAEGMRIRLTSAYDAALRPETEDPAAATRNQAVDLPRGTPAMGMVFQVVIRPVQGEEYIGWEGDPECIPGYVNSASGHRRPTDCSETDGKAEIVVPPPPMDGRAGRYNYRLDGDGERVLVFPKPALVAFRILAAYSDELLPLRAQPEGCAEIESFARGEHAEYEGKIRDESFYLLPSGDATVDIPFYGWCRVPDTMS